MTATKGKFVFFGLVSALLLPLFAGAQNLPYIESIEGSDTVFILRTGTKARAIEGDLLQTDDQIKTGNGNVVRIGYPDGSAISIGQKSILTIDAVEGGAAS